MIAFGRVAAGVVTARTSVRTVGIADTSAVIAGVTIFSTPPPTTTTISALIAGVIAVGASIRAAQIDNASTVVIAGITIRLRRDAGIVTVGAGKFAAQV